MLKDVFRTKNIAHILETADTYGSLKRTLGPLQLTLLGVGAIIGAGIFSTVGTAAAGGAGHFGAGPALVISFAITAVTCGFAALCYAEFASMVPIAGSAYTYAYATFGEMVAWIIGWDLIIEYAVGNVAVAISWSGYFQQLLRTVGLSVCRTGWASITARPSRPPIKYDGRPVAMPLAGSSLADAARRARLRPSAPPGRRADRVQPAGVRIVTLITWILVLGIRESAGFNAVMVDGEAGFHRVLPHRWARST